MINRILITATFLFNCFIICGQKEGVHLPTNYLGVWKDTVSKYQYQIHINEGNLTIKTIGKKEQVYNLKSKNGVFWFEWTKTERIELDVTNNGTVLWLNYKSLKEKYPESVPFISTLRFSK